MTVFVMAVARCSSATLISCTLVGSEASLGGAVASFDASAVSIERTIVARGQGGAVWTGDGSNPANLVCSDLYDNAGGDWTGVLDAQLGLDGNIAEDPLYIVKIWQGGMSFHGGLAGVLIAGVGVFIVWNGW